MGGAQPLAVTMNEGVALCIEVDPERAARRVETRYLDVVADDYADALRRCSEAVAARRPLSVGLVGNAADVVPRLLSDGVAADIVTDQTSAHDPLSYVPNDLSPQAADELRRNHPAEFVRRSRAAMATHVEAMVGFLDAGAEVFDYGNSLRAEAALGGCERAFDYPGFLPAYIRPLFCEGKGPFRWVALSGNPADIAATDRAVLEEFPEDEGLKRWITLAGERVAFQGLPARICWLGYGERHRLGLRFNEMVRSGELAAPIVIGRDHLDSGSVASPYRETEDMLDGSDAIADWPLLGIRLSLLDTLYLHGGLDPASDGGYGPLRPEQARFSDGSAERWADRAEELASAVSGPAVRVGAAVHSVRAVDPPSIKVAADWARERGAPLHFHASEQPAENQQCLDVHGMTPTEVIARAGGLGPGTTLVHATHACERDQAMIGGAGSHCCLCPTTERDLADGTGPSTGLAEAGAGLCLGSDSHATVDIFEEARTVELDQRVATHDRGVFSVAALASMATAGGYRSLGWPEGGTLEAGAPADFATVRLDSVRMAGADARSALAATIFAATGADVHHLVVGGRTVVRGGRHTTIDVAAELASAVAEVTAP